MLLAYKLLYRLVNLPARTDLPTSVKIWDRSTHCGREIALRTGISVASIVFGHSILRSAVSNVHSLLLSFNCAAWTNSRLLQQEDRRLHPQPIERYRFAGFRVLVRSFHASTLSLVLIHAAGITKQHMFSLLQQAFEQLVREEYELDTRYAVCANVLSNYVFSDTATRRPGTKH